jgi:hypothetical protein
MNSEFLIVVVIYEINIKESLTIQRLIKLQEKLGEVPEILVYDNSLISKHDEKYSRYIRYYKHDNKNGGVAAAYNYAYSLAASIPKKWLILFDQDTNINDNYFPSLFSSISTFSAETLFCATVQSNNRIVSPAYYFAERAFVYKKQKSGLLKTRFYTVINSGLAIQVQEMGGLGGFDKNLPLDFSDHYFFSKYKKRNKNFVVFNCVNHHSLSSDSDVTFDVVFNRFNKYRKSTFIYSNKVKSFFPLVWLTIRTLKLTLKFARLDFIKALLLRSRQSS